MKDWLEFQISPLIKYRQNQNMFMHVFISSLSVLEKISIIIFLSVKNI